jgi:hypothetical protein
MGRMKHLLSLLLGLIAVLACSTPPEATDARAETADSQATALPEVRYYVINDA